MFKFSLFFFFILIDDMTTWKLFSNFVSTDFYLILIKGLS